MNTSCIDLSLLPTRGPCSKYELDIAEGKFKGKLELTYESDPMRVSNSITPSTRGLFLKSTCIWEPLYGCLQSCTSKLKEVSSLKISWIMKVVPSIACWINDTVKIKFT